MWCHGLHRSEPNILRDSESLAGSLLYELCLYSFLISARHQIKHHLVLSVELVLLVHLSLVLWFSPRYAPLLKIEGGEGLISPPWKQIDTWWLRWEREGGQEEGEKMEERWRKRRTMNKSGRISWSGSSCWVVTGDLKYSNSVCVCACVLMWPI